MLWASLVHGFSIIGLIDLRNVVASISCDKAAWDAILNNRAVQDLRGSISVGHMQQIYLTKFSKYIRLFPWLLCMINQLLVK
ncbi:unnamed protein product [Coffea canephora]|uniref:Uncharacterized protein n=1 Tax=Coffea canephora TaxID=49390 RepID=A0A068V745_COFCA|nr:unnamed protein product [Coffea canephora]